MSEQTLNNTRVLFCIVFQVKRRQIQKDSYSLVLLKNGIASFNISFQVGGSVFYSDDPNTPPPKYPQSEIETLDRELTTGKEGALLETRLSSLVWICTTTQQASIVTVIDANNPAELLNSFGVCSNHILCIASVPGEFS